MASLTLMVCRRSMAGAALTVAVVAGGPALVACGSGGDDRLVVYSGRTSNLIGPLLEDFAEQSGISIDVRYDESANLALLIDEEGDRTPADVFISQSPGAVGYLDAAGRLAPLDDQLIATVPEATPPPTRAGSACRAGCARWSTTPSSLTTPTCPIRSLS